MASARLTATFVLVVLVSLGALVWTRAAAQPAKTPAKKPAAPAKKPAAPAKKPAAAPARNKLPALYAGLFGPERKLVYQFVFTTKPQRSFSGEDDDDDDPKPSRTWRLARCTIGAARQLEDAWVCTISCKLSAGYRGTEPGEDGKPELVWKTRLGAGTYLASARGLWLGPAKCPETCQRRLLAQKPALLPNPRSSVTVRSQHGSARTYESGGVRTVIKQQRIRLGKKTWVNAWCRIEQQRAGWEGAAEDQLCFAPKLGLVAARSSHDYGTRHQRLSEESERIWLRQP